MVSYGGAITACARAGRVNEALRLVAELRSNEAQAAEAAVRGTPLTRDVSNVRDHKPSMQKKNGSSMRSNVSNMREDSADSGATTTGGVKSPGKALGRIQSNVQSSGESRRSGTFPLPLPNLVTYSAALFACLKVGDVHRGTELLDEMIAAGIKPNRIHCDTLIAAWSAAGEPERAISVMRRLQEHNGFEPSLDTFEAIVWGHAQVCMDRGMGRSDERGVENSLGNSSFVFVLFRDAYVTKKCFKAVMLRGVYWVMGAKTNSVRCCYRIDSSKWVCGCSSALHTNKMYCPISVMVCEDLFTLNISISRLSAFPVTLERGG